MTTINSKSNICTVQNETEKSTKYEHLVISGGGVYGFCLYTAIRDSNLRGEWNIENIKSMYAVSAGTIISTIIALRHDWSVIDEYIINRPLHTLFKWGNLSLTSVFYNCGMFDRTIFIDFLRPFFAGANLGEEDIDIEITMRSFYEKTGISLHFYCTGMTEIKTFEKVEMSAEKTPDLPVIDAIYRSCTIPFIICPQRDILIDRTNSTEISKFCGAAPREGGVKLQQNGEQKNGGRNNIYIDGYLKTNYPSLDCINSGANEENILGFRLKPNYSDINNMIDFVKSIIFAIGNSSIYPLKHEYIVDYHFFDTFDKIYLFFKSVERRRYIINGGGDGDGGGGGGDGGGDGGDGGGAKI